jgi:RimJ/RimL family protein N-acetyltransferase
MTTFKIPTLTTDRLRLRAFKTSDLEAYSAMQANPEVMRYLVTGRTSTPVEVWQTMATSLGAWALRVRHLGLRKNQRRRICWNCRHLSASRLAGTGDFLFARQALLATGFGDRSGEGGARLAVRALSLASGCEFHPAR